MFFIYFLTYVRLVTLHPVNNNRTYMPITFVLRINALTSCVPCETIVLSPKMVARPLHLIFN